VTDMTDMTVCRIFSSRDPKNGYIEKEKEKSVTTVTSVISLSKQLCGRWGVAVIKLGLVLDPRITV